MAACVAASPQCPLATCQCCFAGNSEIIRGQQTILLYYQMYMNLLHGKLVDCGNFLSFLICLSGGDFHQLPPVAMDGWAFQAKAVEVLFE